MVEAFGQQERRNDDLIQTRNSPIGAMDVLLSVCQECGLKTKDVLGKSRQRPISRARMLTAWIWCDRFFRPQIDIAALFSFKPASVSEMIGKMRKDGGEELERQTIETIVNNIQKKTTLKKKSEEHKPPNSRDPNQAQHFLMQRFRNLKENLKT